MALDGSADGTVGPVDAVLPRRRQRRMTKNYSQFFEGLVKSNTCIMASDGSDFLDLELRLPPGGILPDDFRGDDGIRRKIKNIKRSMNLQVND